MHMDFVEEGYWKRCAAVQLAAACKDRVLKIRKDKLENPKYSYEIDGMYSILRYTQVDLTDYPQHSQQRQQVKSTPERNIESSEKFTANNGLRATKGIEIGGFNITQMGQEDSDGDQEDDDIKMSDHQDDQEIDVV